ncbi:MAG: TIGR01459 family HAD-type hydrolase [Halocynthiibacter sp.]
MSQIINNLSEISGNYDALFVDLWGCVHNGVTTFPEAAEALIQYRKTGGTVILVTNSPRTKSAVAKQLAGFGLSTEAYDDIATSGDSAQFAFFSGVVGQKVYHIGTDEELSFYTRDDDLLPMLDITRVPLKDADGIVCIGPNDPIKETPDDYRADFLYAKQMGLKLLCANPDIIVDRGEHREYCAGALAQLYTEMGGESLYFGKPHPPIYDLARRRLAALRPEIEDSGILAIGDGPHTDVSGAIGEGLDVLFISGGLAAQQTKTDGQPDAQALEDYLNEVALSPRFTIGKLR